jgi:hypothetical protein
MRWQLKQHQCKLGVGLQYSGVSLERRFGLPPESTTRSRLGEMPEEESALCFADEKRRAACNLFV